MIDLSRAQIELPLPLACLTAAVARDGALGYELPAGNLGLRCLLADDELVRLRSGEQLVITPGASAALTGAVLALTKPGQTVAIPNPGYQHYEAMVRALGRKSERYQPGRLDLPPRTRLVIVCSPANPTGGIQHSANLRSLRMVASRIGSQVVVDLSFAPFVWTGESLGEEHFSGPRIGSLSKALGVPALRLGWIAADGPIATTVAKALWPTLLGASAITQRLALTMMERRPSRRQLVRRVACDRMNFTLENLERLFPGLRMPEGGLSFLLLKPPGCKDGDHFASLLETKAGIKVLAGSRFGKALQDYVRVGPVQSRRESSKTSRAIQGLLQACRTTP